MNTTPDEKALLQRIEELEQHIRGLEKDLIHDHLTELKTRAFFEEEARMHFELISESYSEKRKGWFGPKHISFLFFDIDHFKKINDTHGHTVGDVVLKKVAHTINAALRQGDTASRWGGEEITVSLLGADENDAHTVALRVLESVQNLQFEEAPNLKVTISCGIATAQEGTSFEELLRKADSALYQAKNSGRNTAVCYSTLKEESAIEKDAALSA